MGEEDWMTASQAREKTKMALMDKVMNSIANACEFNDNYCEVKDLTLEMVQSLEKMGYKVTYDHSIGWWRVEW